jgi:hypothetical protein
MANGYISRTIFWGESCVVRRGGKPSTSTSTSTSAPAPAPLHQSRTFSVTKDDCYCTTKRPDPQKIRIFLKFENHIRLSTQLLRNVLDFQRAARTDCAVSEGLTKKVLANPVHKWLKRVPMSKSDAAK